VDALWGELIGGSSDVHQLVRIVVRVLVALTVGASIGIQRQLTGHAAGLRTHMLIALGTTLFVLACEDLGHDALSRVIQGVATGVGFLGAGAILKLQEEREIFGLTTASGVWLTAGASVCVATGHYVTALLAVVLAWCVLALLVKFEQRLAHPKHDHT
jgi:putative Mg2+ transporter-C (MgtC) family protein